MNDPIANKLTELFGPQCDFNPEWCRQSWRILGDAAKGVYLLDHGNDEWTLTWRRVGGEFEDTILEIASFTTQDVSQWITLYGNPAAFLRVLARTKLYEFFAV